MGGGGQTKDLERLLDEYTISRDGRLLRHARRGGRGPERDVEWPIHADIRIYDLDQGSSQAIVRTLQSLAPGRPLNPWFLEIVGSGTGKEFRPEDNARWTEGTRPIVGAFFHARFFLEMAVRYADLDSPPRPLPSGYAALLELFGLR